MSNEEGRARRKSVKRVDYAKEQEFSDEDVFEDSPDEEPVYTARKRRTGGGGGGGSSAKRPVKQTQSTPLVQAEELGAGIIDDSRPVYTERGYDPSLAPIRERFHFLPEYEEDGSPKIELIVGRRPVDDKEERTEDNDINVDDDEEEAENNGGRKTRRQGKKQNQKSSPLKTEISSAPAEYEYLVKYKGRSYLHLEWKTGADLESMNKSAKGMYRRYLKKLAAGTEDDLENPEFDPSYVIPEKVIDEAEQEITVEMTDEELLQWEKQREKEIADEDDDDDEGGAPISVSPRASKNANASTTGSKHGDDVEVEKQAIDLEDDWPEEEIDFSNISVQRIRDVLKKDGPYYPIIAGSDNPYRDGYVTEPPKKPRASYLFFQCAMRSYFQKKNPGAAQSELMTILGDHWRMMSDKEKEPFVILAKEESEQAEKERGLLEKAQKPNEVWQPLRRCRMVLERLVKDSFAEIFREPVDLEEFPDYEEFVDSPMDLRTVRTKLDTKKYQVPEQFARDMRKVWNNCKIYNQHGSAIWYVADYMSKQFERLYHAWVLEFRERYLRWADPRARPWEHTCRVHDGKCNTPDDQMVLCDHCDAMYGVNCLTPPLCEIPSTAWQCPDCKPKLKSAKGLRMLSAVAENAARKRAELGDLPKKRIKQSMYLVKWAGLGYEFCTWETREDVNDDRLIAQFHRLNNTFPDEPDMSDEIVDSFIEKAKHVNIVNAGGVSSIPSLRSQLYAQSRAFQFVKFGLDLPELLCLNCGPKSCAVTCCPKAADPIGSEASIKHPREVKESVVDICIAVERGEQTASIRNNTCLPPPMTGEYDAIVPITSKGLMMNVGEIHGSVAFLGYRQFADGTKGPAEQKNLIRNVGDKIIAVDGVSTIGKSFREVIGLLRESGKNKFAFMRFLENKYAVCDSSLASVGDKGRYAIEELKKKFVTDRQRMVVQRKQQLIQDAVEVEQSDDDVAPAEKEGDEEEDDSDDEGSEGEFQPDSEDEEMAGNDSFGEMHKEKVESEKNASLTGADALAIDKGGDRVVADASPADLIIPQETTRSLAFRLLDVDLAYSSDEAGEDDCAYHVDGVDSTFSTFHELDRDEVQLPKGKRSSSEADQPTLPARQNEFSTLGERSKLVVSIALSTQPPCNEDFDNFPYSSSKELDADRQKADDELAKAENGVKSTKRSTVKVEQVSVATGEVIHVWANVESAAATLQLPLNDIRQVLRDEYDEDIGDEVGGFKWRYALAGAKVTAGTGSATRGGGGKKAKQAWLEFKDKLYDPSEPHVYKNGNRLRDYQVDGVNWLASTWYKKHGCILADEMGLGKTVQIVCFIEHLYRVEKIRRPYLVVVPLSTVEHWRREFEGWTDMVCCVYHDRQRVWRDVMREFEWYYEDRPHTAEFLKFDVLVTTYDTLIGDFDVISQIPFRVAVVDEAHRLRNQKGKLLECMREISAKGTMHYGFQCRVLMSGTPLQNDLTELWTLLNFIEPFKFPDLDGFQASFGKLATKEQVETLQRMISPFMLRRVKEDVAKDIPSKEETVIDVELTSIQKQYYRAIFEHNHAFLSLGATRQTMPKLMNIQMELRKVCNHPFLLEGVEHRETERKYKELVESGALNGISPEEQQHMLNEHGYVMTSGKMVLLDKLLPKLKQEGHKILIFSQMVRMLDLITEYCEFRDFRYERLDGRVRGTERQKAIDRFEREADSFLFLLSTRAGGVGINLTAADICIIFDSDWNPQNDIQAQARCHRIGQTKDVRIYRLITSRSFEQEMFDRASKKLGLEQAVLGTFEKEREDDKISQQEMEQLLKRGAYALLEDETDEITDAFCSDDIESILAKRTRTRVVEGAKTASWLNKQGLMVSKSKFSAESGTTLDMDDPLFWQKVMPDFVTPSIMLQKLNDLQDEIDGVSGKGRGRGRGRRGRGRPRKNFPKTDEDSRNEQKNDLVREGEETHVDDAISSKENGTVDNKAEDDVDINEPIANETLEEMSDEDSNDEGGKSSKVVLSRANIRKVHKFISDLKSMMEGILEEDEEGLSSVEKDACQKLLLTISVKEKIFNEEQRHLARKFLKHIEGDRRRRCRTSEQQRFNPGAQDDEPATSIPELMIVGKKRKKRKKRGDDAEEEPVRKRRKRVDEESEVGAYVGDDGYLHHSDSEADWSDVGEDIYQVGNRKRESISAKEARRRRQWGADDDDATAAGRAWPVFPRHVVKNVLTTVLDEVIKHDKVKGGLFSVPVPKDEFPEYYEQIKHPMDYGTMKLKLENGEYRSAQAMQKDFILILQNCREFNATSSSIVKEAREQHLLRPKILREAAIKHSLFLAEDGTVLEIEEEEKPSTKRKGQKTNDLEEDAGSAIGQGDEEPRIPRKKKAKKNKKVKDSDVDGDDDDDADIPKVKKGKLKKSEKDREKSDKPEDDDADKPKPRIQIKVADAAGEKDNKASKKLPKRRKRNESSDKEEHAEDGDDGLTPQPEKRKKGEKPLAKKPTKKSSTRESPTDNHMQEISVKDVTESRNERNVEKGKNRESLYLDLNLWKGRREELDGSFGAARLNATKYGPWALPQEVAASRFVEVAKLTLAKMDRNDRYSVFAGPVSDGEAPGYSDVVKNPMDFGTMKSKLEKGEYGTGSLAAAALYNDFLLVFDNCRLYNSDDSDVTGEAARILGLLPEAFVSACVTVAKRT